MELYIGCDKLEVDKNRASAYPMLFKVPVIGAKSEPHLSAKGNVLLELYQENKVSFETFIEYMQYDYALECRRMFGDAPFDLSVIYDVLDPQKMISLALMPVDKVLFLHKNSIERMEQGDTFLTDAVRYTMTFTRGVFVENTEQKNAVERLFGDEIKVQLVEDVADLKHLLETIVNA